MEVSTFLKCYLHKCLGAEMVASKALHLDRQVDRLVGLLAVDEEEAVTLIRIRKGLGSELAFLIDPHLVVSCNLPVFSWLVTSGFRKKINENNV